MRTFVLFALKDTPYTFTRIGERDSVFLGLFNILYFCLCYTRLCDFRILPCRIFCIFFFTQAAIIRFASLLAIERDYFITLKDTDNAWHPLDSRRLFVGLSLQ